MSDITTNSPAISIINGRVIDPANQIDELTDIHFQYGKIVAFGEKPENFVAQLTIDASQQIVCPGLIDLRFRLLDRGYETKGSKFVFKVQKVATKLEVKKAVELMFDVEVDSVQVLNVKGKVKRFGRALGKRSDWKKAYVKLKAGHDIDFASA